MLILSDQVTAVHSILKVLYPVNPFVPGLNSRGNLKVTNFKGHQLFAYYRQQPRQLCVIKYHIATIYKQVET